ncbi:MAG: DUF5666 domain-containing protein [Patescibacteria group bacterium]
MNTYFLIICALFVTFSSQALAVTPTPIKSGPSPSPKPTSESVTQKLTTEITDLKEKIASRVAQLKLVEKRGMIGSIKEINGTTLTLEDINGNNRLIDVDEITKFSSPSAKDSYGLSDLKPGVKISVIGLYNKDSEHLLARFVHSYTIPLYLSGTITEVNKTDFTVTLSMINGKSYLVDIENITKTLSYDADNAAEKIGFSKIETGTRANVIGYADKKQANRMVASRILIFPTLQKNPKIINAPQAVDSKKATTSSGSGKKLTPLN